MKVTKTIHDILPEVKGKKVFILCDVNTVKVGKPVFELLDQGGIEYSVYTFQEEHLKPDEKSVGSAVMHFDASADVILSIGSGILNDIGKMLSSLSGKYYIIVGTAPSMDGFASETSSMERDGLKVSIPTRQADLIVGDPELLKTAPDKMLAAGLGDMLAKYISICDWRVSHVINGEMFNPEVADMIRESLRVCVENTDGLMARENRAVEAVFDGLVNAGLAMKLAGVSRPASGVEHYFSHVWDMRSLEFGLPPELHGIQCGYATYLAAKLYEDICAITPDREKALAYAESFDKEAWNAQLRSLIGRGAETMIRNEEKDGKYDTQKHARRLESILANWEEIKRIKEEEIPPSSEIKKILDRIGIGPQEYDPADLNLVYRATKDIRDKYVLSRLAWDLGIIEEQEVSS